MFIETQLKTLVLSDIIDYELSDTSLLVTTKAKYPSMVDKLVKFKFKSRSTAENAIEVLHNLVEQ